MDESQTTAVANPAIRGSSEEPVHHRISLDENLMAQRKPSGSYAWHCGNVLRALPTIGGSSGIYVIRALGTPICYVGRTEALGRRLREHLGVGLHAGSRFLTMYGVGALERWYHMPNPADDDELRVAQQLADEGIPCTLGLGDVVASTRVVPCRRDPMDCPICRRSNGWEESPDEEIDWWGPA